LTEILPERRISNEELERQRGRPKQEPREEILVRFKVAIFPSEEGFAVCVPSLPGCWSQGATEQEALTNIADAIRDYLEAEEPPPERAELRKIEVTI